MLTAVLILSACTLLLCSATTWKVIQPKPRHSLVGKTVLVHTDAASFRGNLAADHKDRLTLTEVHVMRAGGNDVVLDTKAEHIPKARITSVSEVA